MTVEVLFFAGCPGFAELLPRMRELVRTTGAELVVRAVETPEAAEHERFLGSPTVRVDGRDVDASAGARTDFGLKCRLYRDGDTQTHTPPDAWVLAALTKAGEHEERRHAGGLRPPGRPGAAPDPPRSSPRAVAPR